MSYTIKRDLDFLMSGNYEATNGIFGEVYVNRNFFPMDGKVFCATVAGHGGGPGRAPDFVK